MKRKATISCSHPEKELLHLFNEVEDMEHVNTRAKAFEASVKRWEYQGRPSLEDAIEYQPNLRRETKAATPSALAICVGEEQWTAAVQATREAYGLSKVRVATVLSLFLKYDLLQNGTKVVVPLFGSDSCPLAWEYYDEFYRGSIIAEKYDIKHPIGILYAKLQHQYVVASRNGDKGLFAFAYHANEELRMPKDGVAIRNPDRLRGNVDFNFCGPYRQNASNMKAGELIQIAGGYTRENADLIARLQRAIANSFKPFNHSLMPSVGNLQGAQSIGYVNDYLDRPDGLVAILSTYYESHDKSSWIRSYHEQYAERSSLGNCEALSDYLNNFRDIYHYCRTVYDIGDELVDRMVELGKRRLQNREDVLLFLDLAEDYWKERSSSSRSIRAIEKLTPAANSRK